MDRSWLPYILASDATPSYGLGLSRAMVSPTLTRQVGRLGFFGDFHVRPLDTHDGEQEVERHGTCVRLPVSMQQFQHIISHKVAFKAHAGTLELTAVTTTLKWLARQAGNLSRRITLLIDAEAPMHALRKGRSSAPCFKLEVRKAGVLTLLLDALLHLVYVPSESNPGDPPSRGRPIVAWRPGGRGEGPPHDTSHGSASV